MVSEIAQRIRGNSALGASALVFSSTLLLSIAGYVYNAIATRHLGQGEYGALYALVSLYMVVILPNALFNPVVAKYAAEFQALGDAGHLRGLATFTLRAFSVIAAAYVVLSLVLAPGLAAFLHVQPIDIIVVGIMGGICAISAAMRAVSQGVHSFGLYSLSVSAEAVSRVVAIALFAGFALTVEGGVWAYAISLFVGAIVVTFPLFSSYRDIAPKKVHLDWKRIAQTSAGAAAIATAISLMGFADVVIVRHFFEGAAAGIYSVASLCAKILMYFVSFIPAVLIPQATRRHALGESTRVLLWSAAGFVAVVALVGYLAYVFAGGFIVRVVAGQGFEAAVPLLQPYALAMIFLGMTNTIASYALATHRLWFVLPLLLSTIGTIAVCWALHDTVDAVARELAIGNFIMLLCTAVPLALQARSRVAR